MPVVLIIPEGVESSDGRSYDPGMLTWRDQVPLQFTDQTSMGHDGATFAGNVSNLRRQTVDGQTWIVGDLDYDSDEVAREAERLSSTEKMPGVSADVAVIFEATDELDDLGFPVFRLSSAEIVGVTQVPMPAFSGARILTDLEAAEILPALVAALVTDVESAWFIPPTLPGPTPLTVLETGQVYGHLATWGTCHIGFSDTCVSPPEGTDYSYFHTGSVLVDGIEVPVGQITIDTGHANLSADSRAAVSHYDHTGTVAADICVGEDEWGIWVAGAARPDADLDALRSASLSGDWRLIAGHLELVAALAVNVPGFPIPRTATAVAAAGQVALVASGIVEAPAPASEVQLVTEAVDRLVSRIDDLLQVVVSGMEAQLEDRIVDVAAEEVEVATGRLAQVIALKAETGL
jgi:hypothetical protein